MVCSQINYHTILSNNNLYKIIFLIGRRGSGFFAVININGVDHKVIVTNNHVLNSKEEASYAVARFHYEGRLPGADIRLKPDVLFHTHKVSLCLFL